MAAHTIPFDADRRETWVQDPDAYWAVERLGDASVDLRTAVDELANAIGVQFDIRRESTRSIYQEMGKPLPTPERLQQARQQLRESQAQWTAAVSDAEALLRDRQEGRD
jgi:hypothetical protein